MISDKGGGGVSLFLIFSDKGGGGLGQFLIFGRRGGEGGSGPPNFWLTYYVNSPLTAGIFIFLLLGKF